MKAWLHNRIKGLKHRLSPHLRRYILRHYNIPYSPYGLPSPLLRWWMPSRPVCLIDIGASDGGFTASLLKHYPIRKALLIEPLKHRCEQLRQRFPSPEFHICNAAISSRNETCDFHVHEFDYVSSLKNRSSELVKSHNLIPSKQIDAIKVETKTIDCLLQELEWSDCVDLLKIDVQGSELDVLMGSVATLPRIKAIWCETSLEPIYEHAATFHSVHDFLSAHGFKVVAIEEGIRGAGGQLLQIDALFLQ